MFTLLTNKTFLAGVAVGVVIGFTAYKYVSAEDKAEARKNLPKDLVGVAAKIGGLAVAGKACGMGMGMGMGRK